VSYANRTKRPPRTLSDAEQRRLLKASGRHAEDFRDHVIFSLALGTGLRESEIVGLNIGDMLRPDGKVRRTIQLRVFKYAGAGADPGAQLVHLPDGTFYKVEKYMRARRRRPRDFPLFVARGGRRLSTRRLREIFEEWQSRAGFDHHYNFHALRHTALTNVQRKTGDIRITQRVGRHANISTTIIYTKPGDEEVAAAVRELAS
jgi:integrase/recombinase XerC